MQLRPKGGNAKQESHRRRYLLSPRERLPYATTFSTKTHLQGFQRNMLSSCRRRQRGTGRAMQSTRENKRAPTLSEGPAYSCCERQKRDRKPMENETAVYFTFMMSREPYHSAKAYVQKTTERKHAIPAPIAYFCLTPILYACLHIVSYVWTAFFSPTKDTTVRIEPMTCSERS